MLRYISICSGIEAASLAFSPLGWKPLAFSEIEPFPCAVLAHHHQSIPNFGDMNKFREWPEEILAECDLLVGGPPCFTAGHLVLCEGGYKNIEDVLVGDRVVSHGGRLQSVLRTGSALKRVGDMKGIGFPGGVTCTPEHPFLARTWRAQSTKRNGKYAKIITTSEPSWVPAEDMVGEQWVALTDYATTEMCSPTDRLTDRQAMLMAGIYLGDGWTRGFKGKNKREVLFGFNERKYADFVAAFPDLSHTRVKVRTGVKVHVSDTKLAVWLKDNFGHGSGGKHIPAWVLGHPYRSELLRGYQLTDGSKNANGSWTMNSVSRELAYGVRDLAQTLGWVGSVTKQDTPPTTVIEGRTVNQRPYWTLRIFTQDGSRKSRRIENHLLRKVQSFTRLAEKQRVYNLEVEGDNSYIVEGMVVHNCQAFSVAGSRNSLDDDRGNLTLVYVHLIDHIDSIRRKHGKPPVIALYENVPGLLSVSDNAFGCLVGALCGQDDPVETETGKWPTTGILWGEKRRVGWRVLDAQYFGLAQRRRRVFVVTVHEELIERLGDGCCPSEILSVAKSLRGDTPPRREAREEVTHSTAPCLTSSGRGVERTGDTRGQDPVVAVRGRAGTDLTASTGEISHCLNAGGMGRIDYETETFITHTLRGAGFAASEDRTGRGTPLIPVLGFNSNAQVDEMKFDPHLSAALTCSQNSAAAYPINTQMALRGANTSNTSREGIGLGADGDPAFTLQAAHSHAVAYSMITANTGSNGLGVSEEIAPTLDRAQPCAIAFAQNTRDEVRLVNGDGRVVGALAAQPGMKQTSYVAYGLQDDTTPKVCLELNGALRRDAGGQGACVFTPLLQVRRLTPVECARLQGFPDDYLDITFNKKPATDGHKYKSLGNSMAIPVMAYLGRSIQKALDYQQESLDLI